MEEKIDIWLVGNTGLRNPNRIQEGFKAFANSPYVGKLHGKENLIHELLKAKVSKRKISKLCKVDRNTLDRFIKQFLTE